MDKAVRFTETSWYKNGQKMSLAHFNDDMQLHGITTWWYENGQKEAETLFDNGIPVYIKRWDENGYILMV
jgi:antitoxin component YwqK of YwqJK toxin-antitoxin module